MPEQSIEKQLMSDTNGCEKDNGGCQEFCFATPNTTLCQCQDGVQLSSNPKICGNDPLLLVSS